MARYELDKEFYYRSTQFDELLDAADLTKAEVARTTKISFDVLKMLRTRDLIDETRINFETMCEKGIEFFEMFGNSDLMSEIYKYGDVPVYVKRDAKYYEFYTKAKVAFSKEGSYKATESILVPSDMRKTSAYYLSHELCHILKERNSIECQSRNAYEEVVPILMEFIFSYVTDYNAFLSVVANRCRYIKICAREFIELYKAYISTAVMDEKVTYLSALNEKGRYLHSFYYAISLFEIYMNGKNNFDNIDKDNKEYILSRIANVLLGNESTKEMLNDMMDHIRNIDSLYEDGIDRLNDVTFGI